MTEVIELTQQAGMGRDTIWPERARCVAWLLSGELDRAVSLSVMDHVRTLIADSKER